MHDYIQRILTAQFEASLAMLKQCVEACPAEHWENKIAQGTFRWNSYHALFFCDLYLSTSNEVFQLRDLHRRGGDERKSAVSPGLSKEETLTYAVLCRDKMLAAIAAETEESLAGPSGFSWYNITRGEMHLVNIRHVLHHAA